ncbi:unnamed protein product [Prorocentrum cordatum]|uniref:Phospholipase B-like n=1 Tax=Prorocentrum cordatum TaxID=2364126 RepID=A0ABN9XGS7_9DINO|nr:unnamed protein product [Polarella glacialis]
MWTYIPRHATSSFLPDGVPETTRPDSFTTPSCLGSDTNYRRLNGDAHDEVRRAWHPMLSPPSLAADPFDRTAPLCPGRPARVRAAAARRAPSAGQRRWRLRGRSQATGCRMGRRPE